MHSHIFTLWKSFVFGAESVATLQSIKQFSVRGEWNLPKFICAP